MSKREYGDFRFDLQLFSDEAYAESTSDTQDESVKEGVSGEESKEKSEEDEKDNYTKQEVEKLKKEMAKKQKEEVKKAVSEALKEQKRLSELSDEDRKKEEEKTREQLLLEREKAINFKEKLQEVKDVLLERKLPLSFASYFVSEDSSDMFEKIKDFDKNFKQAVQDEVDSKIKGVSMKVGQGSKSSDGVSIAKFKNEQKDIGINPWAR